MQKLMESYSSLGTWKIILELLVHFLIQVISKQIFWLWKVKYSKLHFLLFKETVMQQSAYIVGLMSVPIKLHWISSII